MAELGWMCVKHVQRGETSKTIPLSPDLLVDLFANLALWVDRIRTQAQAPMVEYVMEVAFLSLGGPTNIGKPDPDYWIPGAPELPGGSMEFPHYPLGDISELPDLISLLHRDFWNSVGQESWREDEIFKLDDSRN